MILSEEQEAVLRGDEGAELALALETLVRYGRAFGAQRLVPIKSAHLTGSFAISSFKGYYELLDRLVSAEVRVKVPTTINPRPGYDFAPQNRFVAFRKQQHHEAQLARLGVTPNYSCVCYHRDNVPEYGDVVGWAESSAVIYANSVIGARTNRNSLMVDICMAVTGLTPEFGLLLDEGRKGDVLVELEVDEMDDDALGYLIGERLIDKVPVLTHYPFDKTQLKNMGAAMAAAGGIGMFHVEGVTPECDSIDQVFDGEPPERMTITQADLDRIRASRATRDEAGVVVYGCPQMTLEEVQKVAPRFVGRRVQRRTLFHVVPSEYAELIGLPLHAELVDAGIEFHQHCPLAALSIRVGETKNVLTTSGKLHYYLSGAEYGVDADVAEAALAGKR